jgi:hypothetical protein
MIAVQGYLFIQKATLKLDTRFTMLQNMDLARVYLQRDLQAAGYRGPRSCDDNLQDLNHIKNLPNIFSAEQIVFVKTVVPGEIGRELPTKIVQKISQQKLKYNADILFIKDIPQAVYKLAAPQVDPCAALAVYDGTDLSDGAWLAIADVNSIERFVASKIIANKYIYHQLPENNRQCFQRSYADSAEVIALQWVAYYLAKENIHATTYTLYRDDLTNRAEGLVDGVEDFYARLLVASNKPVGIEIGLLLKSARKYGKPEELLWRNKPFKFSDTALRKTLIFQVAFRNVC